MVSEDRGRFYLKTSPNLSETRMVCESLVKMIEVGFFGNSLLRLSLETGIRLLP